MSLINEEITPANFEIVRDLVGAILTVELNNQIQYDPEANVKVWLERQMDFDKTELPSISVTLDEEVLDWQTIGNANGELTINIDCFGKGASTKNGDEISHGDKIARILMEKFTRYILKIFAHAAYIRLGLTDTSIIGGTEIRRISWPELQVSETEYITFGRVEFVVKLNETTENFIAPGTANEMFSQVQLGETDKGYFWEITN